MSKNKICIGCMEILTPSNQELDDYLGIKYCGVCGDELHTLREGSLEADWPTRKAKRGKKNDSK